MDPSKAKIVMKLLFSKHLQVKGLRELKKRLLDSANVGVFRKLKLVPILLKIIEEQSSNCLHEESGDACSNEDSNPPALDGENKLLVDSMDVQELEFEDLQKLKDLSNSSAEQEETAYVSLAKVGKVDASSEQILLYAVSLLCTMLQDHGAKQQCDGLEGVRIVMPFITCQSLLIAERAVRATAHMVELPGNNRDMFIRCKGPKLLLNQLLKPNFEEVSFQKALLMAIRLVSCCSVCCEAVLRHQGLETVCVVGLPSAPLQRTAVTVIAAYSSLQLQEALVQLLDGTKDLSLLLRVWQDNRDCANIHASTLRVLVNLVQLASRATEQQHGGARQTWLTGGVRKEGGGLVRECDLRTNAGLTALRLRLLKAFFAIKTAMPLVTEIASYEGAAGEKIVSALCTLCDGSLELKNSPSGRSNVALVWLQVVEAGGIKAFVRLLLKGDCDGDSSEAEEDTSSLARLQKKILRAMLALENNHGIQEIVFKHCLASGILPALTVHFDTAFACYQNCRGPYIEGSLCTHQQAARVFSGELEGICDGKGDDSAPANAQNRRHSSSGLRRSSSACNVSGRWKNIADNRPLSPPLMHPLAPLSPPSSPQEAPKFVYTPYSPPHKKYTQAKSAGASPNPPPQFYNSRSPSASPPHFPSYSPIKPGCASPSFVGGWSSSSCSPSYSPSHSPSYTPPSLYSPSHSPSYSSYSPYHSPTHSPKSPSSTSAPSMEARDLPESLNYSVVKRDRACARRKSEKESADSYSRMKRNRRSSEDVTDEDSKKFKVIRIGSPDSAHVNGLPDEGSNSNETISTSKNVEERGLMEMVTEKLLQTDVKQSFSETGSSSECISMSEGETSRVHEENSLKEGIKYVGRSCLKTYETEQTSFQDALNSGANSAFSLPAAHKVVHVRNMNHIKFRVGKRTREHRSTEPHAKRTSDDHIEAETKGSGEKDKDAPDCAKTDSDNQISSFQASVAIGDIGMDFENSEGISEDIKSPVDDELSVAEMRGNAGVSECSATVAVPCVQKEENVASLEENMSSIEVDDLESKDLPPHLKTEMHGQSSQSAFPATSEQRTISVHVREFNHIKFRVGKRAKDKRSDGGQPHTGPGSSQRGSGHRGGELQPKESLATNSSSGAALTPTQSLGEAQQSGSHKRSTNVKQFSATDPIHVCENKLSSCRLGKSEAQAATRADVRKKTELEESLRHLELVVRIITQVCQIREALSGVCREFLPRVMLYLRHSHRLHPAASRFLSTISQTPCSIQGLLDTFFPAYVAVQLCESLVDVRKKRSSCGCGFCYHDKGACCLSVNSHRSSDASNAGHGKLKTSCSSSDQNSLFEASCAGPLKIKLTNDKSACMAENSKTTSNFCKETPESSKASREGDRCPLQGTNVCNECVMLVTGGQSFLLNMSKFFGHVHRYGSQEAGNRLRPNAPACVRETCSLNIPHIARCPSQLQQLMLNSGGLQDIFSVLKEDEPPSAVRYIYAAAALHAVANAVEISSQVTLGKGCALCLISAAAEGEAADENKDCAGKPHPPNLKTTKMQENHSTREKKKASEISRVLHGKCFWSEQVDHDVTLVCGVDDVDDDLMEHQEAWRQDEDEYSEEELTDGEGFLDDNDSSTSDFPSQKPQSSRRGIQSYSPKPNVHRDDTDASDQNTCPKPKSDGIQAHRSVLCGASEVWAVMLGEQGWREASDGVIKVGGLGLPALTAIVHHLYGCACTALSSLTLHEYVELLHACHMYGLKHLQTYAAHRIVQTCNTAADVLDVYHASVGLVDEEVIKGVLVRMVACKGIRSWRRAQWLHTLAHSPPGEQLLNNIHSFLFHALQANRDTCTCDTSQGLYMTSNSVYSKLI